MRTNGNGGGWRGWWLELGAAGFLMLTVMGCAADRELQWVDDQHKRCGAMFGRGAYDRASKLFECFRQVPFSVKIEINADIARNTPGVIKLFEARYRLETGGAGPP